MREGAALVVRPLVDGASELLAVRLTGKEMDGGGDEQMAHPLYEACLHRVAVVGILGEHGTAGARRVGRCAVQLRVESRKLPWSSDDRPTRHDTR